MTTTITIDKDILIHIGAQAAILYSQLQEFIKTAPSVTIDGQVYYLYDIQAIQQETGFTYQVQLRARKRLEDRGYITTINRGLPPRTYYRIKK